MAAGKTPVPAAGLVQAIAAILAETGVEQSAATIVAQDLVSADVEGVASHGAMLVPLYVEKLQAGAVSTASQGTVVSEQGCVTVLDAMDVMGQLTARQAVAIALNSAKAHGMGAVAVRNAFHFGAAGPYARMIADGGAVGIVMSNTRPLMPAPGGAEPVTGNNPVAIAAPSAGAFAPEVDMALSAAAMGKIRNAAAAGQSIPAGWAADKDGSPTQDPEAAIAGMLLPAAGPKGFGLAFLIDLLAGGLSGGRIGAEVAGLYADRATPYRCSNLFLAIDVGHFLPAEEFKARAQSETDRVAASRKAPGVDRVFAPGEMAYVARATSDGMLQLPTPTWDALVKTGASLGLNVPALI